MIYTSKTYASKSVNLDLSHFLLLPGSSTEIFSHSESFVGKLDAENVEFYLMGDFNCNLASPQPDINTVLLTNIVDIYNLYQLMRGTLGCIRNRKTEEKIIQNRKKIRPKPKTAYKTDTMVTSGAYRANYTNTLFHQSIYECHGLYFCRSLEHGLYGLIFPKAFRGYRAFSCDLSGNSALLSLKRFLLFRRKNKVIDHVSENRHLVPYGTLHSIYQALVQPHFNYCNIV